MLKIANLDIILPPLASRCDAYIVSHTRPAESLFPWYHLTTASHVTPLYHLLAIWWPYREAL